MFDSILESVFSILLWLDAVIYSFIAYIYKIILVIAQGKSIFDSSRIEDLVDRLYIILGVIMLFVISYSLLQAMLNPDNISKLKNSPAKIIKDIVISVVGIAIVPYIFDFAFGFQTSILLQNTIGRIIIGNENYVDSSGDSMSPNEIIDQGGFTMADTVLYAFLRPNQRYCATLEEERTGLKSAGGSCAVLNVDHDWKFLWYEIGSNTSYATFRKNMKKNTSFLPIVLLNEEIVDDKVSYYFLVSSAAGVFVMLVLMQYCFDMAMRLVKLSVYQLFAPIALFARMMPFEQAKSFFGNWLKATLSTYTEVFVRIAILFFSVFMISVAVDSIPNIFTSVLGTGASWDLIFIAQALIILAIIMFIKEFPGFIKELTGLDGGKFNVFGSAMKTAAVLGGGTTAAVRNWNDKGPDGEKGKFNRFRSAIGGAGSAAMRSTFSGNKINNWGDMVKNANSSAAGAMKAHNQRAARNARYGADGKNAITGRWGDFVDDFKAWGGFSGNKEALEAKKKIYDDAQSYHKQLMDLAATDESVMFYEGQLESLNKNGLSDDVKDGIRQQMMDKFYAVKREKLKKQLKNDANLAGMTDKEIDERANILFDSYKESGVYSAEESALENDIQNAIIDATQAELKKYNNLIKMAKYKVIHEKLAEGKDARYTSVQAGFETFVKQHQNDEVVKGMKIDISSEEAKYIEDTMRTNNAQAINDAMKDMKNGSVRFVYDNEELGKASAGTAKEIAQIRQKEQARSEEK